MKLYIKQKVFSLGDKYYVFNEMQQPVFAVQGRIFSMGAKIHVFDMTGQELYFIQQKLFRFLPEYHIFAGDILCAIVKKEFSFFKPRLAIQSQYRGLWKSNLLAWILPSSTMGFLLVRSIKNGLALETAMNWWFMTPITPRSSAPWSSP